MRRRCQHAPIKWLCGIILLSLGMGMLLSAILPYCVPLLAILLISAGSWLIYCFRRC